LIFILSLIRLNSILDFCDASFYYVVLHRRDSCGILVFVRACEHTCTCHLKQLNTITIRNW